ncbi:helix-turn-helix transcriptional regulator [Henriciella sp.]|jgi:DNA-binding transcriptional ArsR family regulator|uniref:ArsR/SmtB family transcription factor n=1 Tax=Henriciella sp. TaxID=1968823 RepID=UPI000C0FD3C0|nr:metalloregulator ArsR/SmtB family transcription factor [Henriciella sp.]PHR76780.1 MAG: transcriptional regulator [Henriciella sp.]|tara:strand:+ start:925 stop:1242 length:318 start_codon:yes stop_codon:yes gene_type:complete
MLKTDPVPLFAALGDRTRLLMVTTLADGRAHSISDLASDFAMSRQAVTKHLKVLKEAGLVSNQRVGRESRFRLVPEGLDAARDYLQRVSAYWAQAIERLQDYPEA